MNYPPARCWLEIDLGALERNLLRLRAQRGALSPVVAELGPGAFGLGAEQMVARLMQSGADAFAVHTLEHAEVLQKIGSGWPIYLAGPLSLDEAVEASRLGVIAVLVTPLFKRFKEALGAGVPAWLRLEQPEAFSELLLKSSKIRPEGVWLDHAVGGLDPEDSALAGLPLLVPLSAKVEGASVRMRESLIGLFAEHPEQQLEALFSFRAIVGLVKELPKGTTISYARTHQLKRDSRVAILTVGYGDGFPTTLSNRGAVLIRGCRCPILGRVTMDQTIVDVTDCPTAQAQDVATLIGRDSLGNEIPMQTVSDWAETGAEELLCALTARVQRQYRAARTL